MVWLREGEVRRVRVRVRVRVGCHHHHDDHVDRIRGLSTAVAVAAVVAVGG